MNTSIIGMDTSKHCFYLDGGDERGKNTFRKKLYRDEVLEFFAQHSPCLVVMEACGGSHYWGREISKFGHEVKLIAPQFVKPYVKSNKNDRNDAAAIREAGSRPEMRFVGVKSIEQQDIQAIHRIRQRLVRERTALANEIRGLLSEYGIIIPKGIKYVRNELMLIVDKSKEKLTAMGQQVIYELREEFSRLDKEVKKYDEKIEMIHKAHPVCQRLATIPGVGPIIATAVVAAVGDPSCFKNGRQFAAYCGLVPKQNSSGGKERLLGISKRGDVYLRHLIVHGARSVLRGAKCHGDKRSIWALQLKSRRGMNKAVVALANKNARVIWALLVKDTRYFASIEKMAA